MWYYLLFYLEFYIQSHGVLLLLSLSLIYVEKFADTKGVIRIENTMAKKKKDKQLSTKHSTKTKDWETLTPLNWEWT